MTDEKIPAEVGRFLDWLDGELLKGGFYEMTCPNCESEMQFNAESGRYECGECGYIENAGSR